MFRTSGPAPMDLWTVWPVVIIIGFFRERETDCERAHIGSDKAAAWRFSHPIVRGASWESKP
jgi:hypothetical protein